MSSAIRRIPILRAVAVLAIAFGLFAATPVSAGAATACVLGNDYASTMQLTVNPPTTTPGSTVVITGTGYPKNCELEVFVDGESIGTAVTDGNGTFHLNYQVPAGTPASQLTITTNIGGSVETAVLQVVTSQTTTTVVTSPGQGSSNLPTTGSQVLPFLAGGVALLVLGSLVVLSTRKRNTRQI
jgi:LPXTG-motif cell wall-anchored protein